MGILRGCQVYRHRPSPADPSALPDVCHTHFSQSRGKTTMRTFGCTGAAAIAFTATAVDVAGAATAAPTGGNNAAERARVESGPRPRPARDRQCRRLVPCRLIGSINDGTSLTSTYFDH